jgi:hypothetical protein
MTEPQRAEAWSDYGPEIEGPYDAAALGMRLLAIANMDDPRSQFVSVALDFNTASSVSKDGYVYAFQAVPYSQIQVLKNCVAFEDGNQVQLLVGTAVFNLCRTRAQAPGDRWEAWNYTGWVPPAFHYCP